MFKLLKYLLSVRTVKSFSELETFQYGAGFYHKNQRFIPHTSLHLSESAVFRSSPAQIIIACIVVGFFIINFFVFPRATLVLAITCMTLLYFIDLIFNLFLIYRSFAKSPEIVLTPEQLATQRDWPSYTILCPLYKESEVLPQFVSAMNQLDYPDEKLQILLLLEEDDTQTIEYARQLNLPPKYEVVVVPHSLPKTKPKACNYGLKRATGQYTVIYDAEDMPESNQLKKAVLAFERAGQNTACIQAKLNFYNPRQNILTRIFTAEYSLWFDLVLTGLQSIEAPIPLGGTSNHFPTHLLHHLEGWDAFNVTEDCDLGMRLVKRGFHTAIVDSTTWEEANSHTQNWFWQRTRWIKGYIQTYFVHMRRPKQLLRSWKQPHVLTFQLVVGGKVASMFINPIMWIITLSYFLFRPLVGPAIESLYPTPVLYMAVPSLVIGNFMYLYYYMIGCAKREQDDLIKYAFLVPVYWLYMSMAAWVAVYKFIVAPHHWSKTKHGLHLQHQPKSTPHVASSLALAVE